MLYKVTKTKSIQAKQLNHYKFCSQIFPFCILKDTDFNIDYEGSFEDNETRVIIWTLNFTMKNGIVKKYPITLPETARDGDTWKVIINNINGTYKTQKL